MIDKNIDYKDFLETNLLRLTMELVEWMEGEMIELNKTSQYRGSIAEIKLFNAGIVSTPDSKDIPTDASDYSLNVEPLTSDGKVKGRKTITRIGFKLHNLPLSRLFSRIN